MSFGTAVTENSKHLLQETFLSDAQLDKAAVGKEIRYLHEVDITHLTKVPTDYMCIDRPALPTDFVMQVVSLVLSIATTMSSATVFINGVPKHDKSEFGLKEFEVVGSILIYFPLIYAFLLIPLYNNKESVDAYYDYLQHGVLVDFPDSSSISFIATHPVPLLCVISFLGYFLFSVCIFIKFWAPATMWVIFFKQFGLEIVLFWKSHQNIEDGLISLTCFLEAFDDRSDDPIVDSYTVSKASKTVATFQSVRSRASYKGYTSKYGLRRKSNRARLVTKIFLFVLIAMLCGISLLQFQNENASGHQEEWEGKVNVCVQVCFDRSQRDKKVCYDCLCSCATAFNVEIEESPCKSYLDVPGCDNAEICTTNTTMFRCGQTHNSP